VVHAGSSQNSVASSVFMYFDVGRPNRHARGTSGARGPQLQKTFVKSLSSREREYGLLSPDNLSCAVLKIASQINPSMPTLVMHHSHVGLWSECVE
jgi:hypothetical protein